MALAEAIGRGVELGRNRLGRPQPGSYTLRKYRAPDSNLGQTA